MQFLYSAFISHFMYPRVVFVYTFCWTYECITEVLYLRLRYSQGLCDLLLSLLVVDPTERPDIQRVLTRLHSLSAQQENRV